MRWDRTTLILPLVILGYLTPHVFLLAEERFHYALVPVFAIFASLCWTGGWQAISHCWRESRAGKIAVTLAVLVLALLLFNWGYELVRDADKLSLLFGPNGNQTWFPY
jgi:hypothetical protein